MRVVCEELDADDLFNIMKYSEGSLLRQYERAFRAYGIEISFEDEALRLLAEAAAKEKTGARGLLTVFEKLFRDYKYYLAGSGLSQLRVTAALVREPQRVLDRLMAEGHKLEAQMLEAGARRICREIQQGAWIGNCFRRSGDAAPGRARASRADDHERSLRSFIQGLPVRIEPHQKEHGPNKVCS